MTCSCGAVRHVPIAIQRDPSRTPSDPSPLERHGAWDAVDCDAEGRRHIDRVDAVTITEAAQRAGVSASFIRQARTQGRFPGARRGSAVGRRQPPWLIPLSDLDNAGFHPKERNDATHGARRPYLEEQVKQLEQSINDLRGAVESHSQLIAALLMKLPEPLESARGPACKRRTGRARLLDAARRWWQGART